MKSILLRCNGINCSNSAEAPCEALPEGRERIEPPDGWLWRRVADNLTVNGYTRPAEQIFHYCPDCIPNVDPPITSAHRLAHDLRSWAQKDGGFDVIGNASLQGSISGGDG